MNDALPRRSAALGFSVALHAALLVALAARGVVQLALEPAPLVLTLVEASDRTAGPGALAPELRVAAPGGGQPAQAAPLPVPSPEEPEPPAPEPVPEPVPAPVAPPKPSPPPKPTKAKPAPPREPAPARVGDPAAPAAPAPSTGAGSGESSALGQPGGSGSVSTAPAWSPVARVRYEELLFAWMSRHKQYPLLARRRGLEGVGAVRVRIDRDGRVVSHSLQRSTGQALLDEATLDMVRRASPFPAVPAEYAGTSFEFVAPVEYRLR